MNIRMLAQRVLGGLAITCSASCFANITINPVILEITADKRSNATQLTLENSNDGVEHSYEIKVFKWTQDQQGQEILVETDELLLNPRTVHLPVNSKRLIRVGFKKALQSMDLSEQQAWRILFQELPKTADETGMGMSINFSVPLFVHKNKDTAPTQLHMKLNQQATRPVLTVTNQRPVHSKIMKIDIVNHQGQQYASFEKMKYILANQTWSLPLEQVNSQVKGPYRAQVSVDQISEAIVFDIQE